MRGGRIPVGNDIDTCLTNEPIQIVIVQRETPFCKKAFPAPFPKNSYLSGCYPYQSSRNEDATAETSSLRAMLPLGEVVLFQLQLPIVVSRWQTSPTPPIRSSRCTVTSNYISSTNHKDYMALQISPKTHFFFILQCLQLPPHLRGKGDPLQIHTNVQLNG